MRQHVTPSPIAGRLTGRGLRETGRTEDNAVRQEAAVRWLECVNLLNASRRAQDPSAKALTYRELGLALAEASDWRQKAYDQSIAFRLSTGERALRIEDCLAMARLLGSFGVAVDPGWIALGPDSNAPAPSPLLLAAARRTLAQ